MNIKNKIVLVLTIFLLLLSIFSQNESLSVSSLLGAVVLIVGSRIADYLYRSKLIKEIQDTNLNFIKVKENNKWMIFLIIVMSLNLSNAIKSRFEIYKMEITSNINDMSLLLNTLTPDEKLLVFSIPIFLILALFTITQVLFNSTIISKDKVIFYDGLVFDISEIDEIEYGDSFMSKNKKVIKLEKGVSHRKLIVNLEDFDKVKNILNISVG